MVQRITYRRRLSYNTRSNRRKITRTPGGKLVFQYLKKRPAVPKCPMTGIKLKGIKPTRPSDRPRLSLRHKKVFGAYGGEKQTVWLFFNAESWRQVRMSKSFDQSLRMPGVCRG